MQGVFLLSCLLLLPDVRGEKGLHAAGSAACPEASLAALGHCRRCCEAPGSPSDRTEMRFWGIFHMFSSATSETLTQLCSDHPVQGFLICDTQAPATIHHRNPPTRTSSHLLAEKQSPSQTWLLHFLPASISPHQAQPDPFLLRMTPTPCSSSQQCPPSPKGKHKGEVARKPQNTQVRKCKVSTKASFLFLPEHSFSHTAYMSPSPFEALSQWEQEPSQASSQQLMTCLCTRSGMLGVFKPQKHGTPQFLTVSVLLPYCLMTPFFLRLGFQTTWNWNTILLPPRSWGI